MPSATLAGTAVLVDSSLWVHQLRKSGDSAQRDRVNTLLQDGRAWCPPVRLELWRGVTNDVERKVLRHYEALLPDYEISSAVWERAVRLTDRGRAAGVTIPLADLLIFACATEHRLQLVHDDNHFTQLEQLDACAGRVPTSLTSPFQPSAPAFSAAARSSPRMKPEPADTGRGCAGETDRVVENFISSTRGP